MTEITIANSVANIDDYAFMYCRALTDVWVDWPIPLPLEGGMAHVFFGVDNLGNVNLHVPEGTQCLYATAPVWEDFKIGAQFTITATASIGGWIWPDKTVSVNNCGKKTYYFIPNDGYKVDVVLVDGFNVGAVDNYTFSNVTENHTVHVTFSVAQFTITATAGNGGRITPDGTVYANYNESKTFTFTPNNGYKINEVFIDGANVGAISSYTFSNVTENYVIHVTFSVVTFTISATDDIGGKISPNETSFVNYGESLSYTFTPNDGYKINEVFVDGVNIGAVDSYTFSNVTANHTIHVTFSVVTLTISATAGVGGKISPNETSSVNYGESLTYTFTPNDGYKVNEVFVDGATIGAVSSYTFSNVTANHTIHVNFSVVTGIDDVVAHQLQIYPNPVQNEIFVETGVLKIGNVEIYDLSGRKLLHSKFSSVNSQLKINVSSLLKGVYLIRVHTDKGLIIKRFVKE